MCGHSNMETFTTLTGRAAPLLIPNIDTDVIIRIERLSGVPRAELGRYAFEALRYRPDGSEDPAFVLNESVFRGAPIVLAGPNFGCGSSREAAVGADGTGHSLCHCAELWRYLLRQLRSERRAAGRVGRAGPASRDPSLARRPHGDRGSGAAAGLGRGQHTAALRDRYATPRAVDRRARCNRPRFAGPPRDPVLAERRSSTSPVDLEPCAQMISKILTYSTQQGDDMPGTQLPEQIAVRCTLMRGGTSKGVYFHEADVQPAGPARDWFLKRMMGTPDVMQIDGLGGSRLVTSKVAIVNRSARPDADVDYTFAQVDIEKDIVEYDYNCGNISSGVGPFAIDEGLVDRKSTRPEL